MIELSKDLELKISIEAIRHQMEPVDFLERVLSEWQDATYIGKPIHHQKGYSGVEKTFYDVRPEDRPGEYYPDTDGRDPLG